MKILVLHDEIYPNRSANARIAYCVIDELLKYEDVQITILGRAVKPEQRAPYYKNCPVIHEPYMRQLKADEARRRAGKFSRLKYLYYPRTILTHFAKQPNQYSYEAIRWVKRNAHKFDVILAFTMPFYTLELATLVSNKVPFVFYQMETTYDRPTTHYGLYHVSQNMISRWSSAASRIIATSLLYSTYDKPTISQFKSKVRIAEFPNVRPHDDIKVTERVQLPSDTCNVVYVGQLYPGYRDPNYIFKIFEQLSDTNIHLHLFGNIQGKYPEDFYKKYFENQVPNIHYHGEVSPFEADAAMQTADILVHLGNPERESLPSKILDYISSGKPILNVCQIYDCPTISILENYSLKLNLFTGDAITCDLVQMVKLFCEKNRGEKLPFEQIEPLYEEYTPKVVGQTTYNTLKEAIDEFNNKSKI